MIVDFNKIYKFVFLTNKNEIVYNIFPNKMQKQHCFHNFMIIFAIIKKRV